MKKKNAVKHDLQTVLDAVRGDGMWSRGDKETSSFGNMTTIAKRLGVYRQTVYNYAKRWAAVRQAIEEERERKKDFVEDKMFQRIIEGSDTMMIFFAKTQMKDRGYVERTEIASPDGITLRIVRED